MTTRLLSLALALALAGCAAAPPRIAAPPPPAKPPTVLPPPQPDLRDWRDQGETPGTWSYARGAGASAARFGRPGAVPDLELRCDNAARAVRLSRIGVAGGALTVTTTYGSRVWPASTIVDGRTTVTLAASDPLLDQIAFSRGRWEVTGPGLAPLILPAWAEPARVIEDCRG